MPEMTPLEAEKIIDNEVKCVSSDCDRDCSKCNLVLPEDDIVSALRMASSYLRAIAAGEYKQVAHATPRKINPADPKALFEKQCPECDSLLFATDNFCGNCGALMDGKDDSHE